MFSSEVKAKIASQIQKILRETNDSELPDGEIRFQLHVEGKESWSWADIVNNGAVEGVDSHIVVLRKRTQLEINTFILSKIADLESKLKKITEGKI